MGFRQRLKHAFEVEKPEDLKPTEEQKQIVDTLCREIVRRGMTTPVDILLEVGQPLNYLGAHFLHFIRPAVSAVFNTHQYRIFAEFLEHRGAMEYIRGRLLHFEQEFTKREQDEVGREDTNDGEDASKNATGN
jgi:hypothetical protein